MATRINRPILACVIAAFAFPASAQTPEAFLQSFQGTWTGSGDARLGPDEPWETNAASCTIEIEWRGELRSHGVCDGIHGRFSAGGAFGIDGGTFMVPHFVDVAAASAGIAGNAIVADYEIEGMQFRLTVTTDGRGVMLMQTELATPGGWVSVGNMRLEAV